MTTPDRPVGAGLVGGGLWPAHIPRPTAPAPIPTLPGAATADTLPPEVSAQRWPWRGVQWTLTFVGFLGYIYSITTYRFPIGDVSIVVSLIGLLTMKEPVRVPGLLKGLGVFLLWAMMGYAMSNFPALVYPKLDAMVRLWLISLVAANALRTRQQLRFFLVFWLACFAIYPVRGALFNYYLYGEKLAGRAIWNYIFNNPNDLAAFCILQLSMAFGVNALEAKGPVRFGARLGLARDPAVDPAHEVARRLHRIRRVPAVHALGTAQARPGDRHHAGRGVHAHLRCAGERPRPRLRAQEDRGDGQRRRRRRGGIGGAALRDLEGGTGDHSRASRRRRRPGRISGRASTDGPAAQFNPTARAGATRTAPTST